MAYGLISVPTWTHKHVKFIMLFLALDMFYIKYRNSTDELRVIEKIWSSGLQCYAIAHALFSELMFIANTVHVGNMVSSVGWVWCFSKYFGLYCSILTSCFTVSMWLRSFCAICWLLLPRMFLLGWEFYFVLVSSHSRFTLLNIIVSIIRPYLSSLSITSIITPVRSHSEPDIVLPQLLSSIQSSEFYTCFLLSLSKIRREFTYSLSFVSCRSEMYPFCKENRFSICHRIHREMHLDVEEQSWTTYMRTSYVYILRYYFVEFNVR
jgi:hypothetical protein